MSYNPGYDAYMYGREESKELIEKLKCCGNCKSWGFSHFAECCDEGPSIYDCQNTKSKGFCCVRSCGSDKCDDWEMRDEE